MFEFYTCSPAGPGEPAGHEEEEEQEDAGGDEETTAELKKHVEEHEDEKEEEEGEDEQEERAKVDLTKAVDEAANTPEASGKKQHLCEDVQLQSECPSVSRMSLPSSCPRQRDQRSGTLGHTHTHSLFRWEISKYLCFQLFPGESQQ